VLLNLQQVVLPIKDSNVLKEVQDTLLHNFKAGRRKLHHLSGWKGHSTTRQRRYVLENERCF